MGAVTTLEQIGADADERLYPRDRLTGDTALILFAAGFLGVQDGYWIATAGLRATCVDIRPHLLDRMAVMYPTDWEFVEDDAYTYARRAQEDGRTWDVLSIDCPSNHFDRCADLAPLWCSLAERAVVLGTSVTAPLHPPAGWRLTDMVYRSNFAGGTYWAVLESS